MKRQISVLYNLKPEGLENGLIESLSSYLIRISFKHNVYVGDLINKIIIPEMGKEYLKRSAILGGNSFFDGAKTLNGFNSNSKETIKVMEKLTTRMDLFKLTLDNFKIVFSSRELLNDYLSWCPICINEWCVQGGEKYYPLLWYVKLSGICQIHKIKLSEKCYYCNNRVKILSRTASIGYCTSCKAKLNHEEQLTETVLDDEKEEWYEFCIQNIAFILSEEFRKLELEEYSVSVQLQIILAQYFNNSLDEFSKFSAIPKTTLRSWIKQINKPTVQGVLKICFKLHINIHDFFKNIDKVILEPVPILVVKKRTRNNMPLEYEFILDKLNELLFAEVPVSMKKAAEIIGRDKRVLYANFSKECKQISMRYGAYQKETNEKRIMNLKNDINRVFESLLLHGIFPSRAKIEKELNLNSIFREQVINEYWKELIANHELEKGDKSYVK